MSNSEILALQAEVLRARALLQEREKMLLEKDAALAKKEADIKHKEIKLLDNNFSTDVVLEELFHFYQDHFYPNGLAPFAISPYTGRSNIEWEAHFSGYIITVSLLSGKTGFQYSFGHNMLKDRR